MGARERCSNPLHFRVGCSLYRRDSHWYDVPATTAQLLQVADSERNCDTPCVQLYADLLHKSDPFVHVDLVEVQGLQREYDRFLGYRERVCCLPQTKSNAFAAL